MVSNKLINLISSNTDKLCTQWTSQVKKAAPMKSYQKLSDDELHRRNRRFFENLVKWIEQGAAHDEIKSYFSRIGKERYQENIPLDEINFGIIIAKRVLWDFILSEGFFSNAAEIYQALEMITIIYNFFDFGLFYIDREYFEEMRDTLSKEGISIEKAVFSPHTTRVSDKDLESMFGIKIDMK